MRRLPLFCAALATGANAFGFPSGAILRANPAIHHPSWKKNVFTKGLMPPRSFQDFTTKTIAMTPLKVSRGVEDYAAETMGADDEIPSNTGALGVFALFLFTCVSRQLQVYLNEPCLAGGVCTEEYRMFAEFFRDHGALSFGLILTHAIPFALIPYTMKLINEKGKLIKKAHPEFNPFIMTLGMATICFGLALEFGWHVTSSWYYANEFHILNFGFYFFLISSFALWADGFENNTKMDSVFALVLLVASLLYPMGNEVQVYPDKLPRLEFLQNPGLAKIPLYVGMTVTFASITIRGRKIFGNKMFGVFFLSVIVNLGFIFLLDGYSYEPGRLLDIRNYIFHICHDVLGTEAGIAYFAYLLANYESPQAAPLPAKKD